MNNLSQISQRLGDLETAITRGAESVEIQRKGRDPQHPLLARALKNHGLMVLKANRFEEAESLLLEALDIYRSQFGDDHDQVRQSRDGLVQIYTAWGRPDLADRYRDP